MIVRMRTTAAGPDGQFLAGRKYDLPKETAQTFVDGGFAEIANGNKKEPVLEVASLEPAPETTTKPKSNRRGRKRADKIESGGG